MRIVIHIGFHKCGSTALQYGMAKSRGFLAAQNVSYPAALAIEDGHHALAWALGGQKREGMPDLSAAQILDTWIAEAVSRNCTNLVLSSEEFEFSTEADIQKLKILLQHHDAEIYAYLRPQDEYLLAEYKQHVRMSETAFSGSIENFYFKHFQHLNAQLDYYRIIRRWADVFGAARIKLTSFDRKGMIGGDILEDFIAAIGLQPFPWPEQRDVNLSWSNTATKILAAINKIGISPAKRWYLATHLDRIVRDCGHEIELLDGQSRGGIMNGFHHGNQKLLIEFRPRGDAARLVNRVLPEDRPQNADDAMLAVLIQLVAEIVGK